MPFNFNCSQLCFTTVQHAVLHSSWSPTGGWPCTHLQLVTTRRVAMHTPPAGHHTGWPCTHLQLVTTQRGAMHTPPAGHHMECKPAQLLFRGGQYTTSLVTCHLLTILLSPKVLHTIAKVLQSHSYEPIGVILTCGVVRWLTLRCWCDQTSGPCGHPLCDNQLEVHM